MYEVLHFVRLAGALVVGQKAHLWKDAVKAYGIGGVECRGTAAQQLAECGNGAVCALSSAIALPGVREYVPFGRHGTRAPLQRKWRTK